MGNGFSSSPAPFTRGGTSRHGRSGSTVLQEEKNALGHAFIYVPSKSTQPTSLHSPYPRHSFSAISGASVSANATFSGCVLESSSSFSSRPLKPSSDDSAHGFDFSSPRPSSPTGRLKKHSNGRGSVLRHLRRSASERNRLPSVVPVRYVGKRHKLHRDMTVGDDCADDDGRSMQWASVKAGEDRVHAVVSEQHRFLFVGIYDGFNGNDAPDFLVRNLYRTMFNQLKDLLTEAAKKRRHENGNTTNVHELFTGHDGDESSNSKGRHNLILGIMSRALEMTEVDYLELTDAAMKHNPEIALMGSCVLAVLVISDDVYVLNLGDSRAIVAQYRYPQPENTNFQVDGIEEGIVEQVNEGKEELIESPSTELGALQLCVEHSTSNPEEVRRIKEEHPDDKRLIIKEKIKGRLKVTRAFGVGYMKKPKWNAGLLKMFRHEYVGTQPYISSSPSLFHHKLGSSDLFLVLSSDGIYQYLTNEEVVSHVGNFMEKFPDGDPAESLVEELLIRAAKNAGMTFHELLEIPNGERRKYHDDVIVIVVSVEGRIWKSSR